MHDKDSTPIEAIDIESLGQNASQTESAKENNHSKFLIGAAFLILLVCVLSVFFLLPEYVMKQPSESTVEKNTVFDKPATEDLPDNKDILPEPEPKFSAEELNALKLEAEKLLIDVIDKQKLLEDKAVKKWANEEYRIAISLGTEGDEYFRKQHYDEAIISYKSALDVLSDLQEKISSTLAMHLEKGEQALTKAEKNVAKYHFELANAIDNSNSQANEGLQRAETIEQLFALLETGGKFEAANRFDRAKNTYLQATQLDPLSKEAQDALNRVDTRLTQLEFARLLNQGHASLKLGQYNDAKAAYNTALKLVPNSDKAKQGLANIQQALLDKKLAVLHAEAQHFETNEDWSNAAKTFQQVLKLSPNSRIAQQGFERNKVKESILLRLDEHNDNFLRLSSKSVAKEATELLAEVNRLKNPGNKIEHAASNLKRQIELANQPITITLQSDKQTDVVIYKVGKLGKFSDKKVVLKPGKYTIVGSRDGYRDVRKEVKILAEMGNKIIQVQCEEPI